MVWCNASPDNEEGALDTSEHYGKQLFILHVPAKAPITCVVLSSRSWRYMMIYLEFYHVRSTSGKRALRFSKDRQGSGPGMVQPRQVDFLRVVLS